MSEFMHTCSVLLHYEIILCSNKIKIESIAALYILDSLSCNRKWLTKFADEFFLFCGFLQKNFPSWHKLPDPPLGGANIMFLLTYRQIKIKKCQTQDGAPDFPPKSS